MQNPEKRVNSVMNEGKETGMGKFSLQHRNILLPVSPFHPCLAFSEESQVRAKVTGSKE
jgi:hypothetical protein